MISSLSLNGRKKSKCMRTLIEPVTLYLQSSTSGQRRNTYPRLDWRADLAAEDMMSPMPGCAAWREGEAALLNVGMV